ncbi:MAG: RNA polymerase sigma factor [Acidobacteriota bacterium]
MLTSSPSENEIDPDRGALERTAAGDVEAFGAIVERHEARLYRLCFSMLGDREEAREATQDAFLKAFRGAPSWKPRGRVYTWLYRIAVNGCLNRLRRRKLAHFLGFGDLAAASEDEAGEWDPADDGPSAERRLADRRAWLRTRRAVEALPANQRAVLVLAKFEGLSYREIAETLEITPGAVESRLFRAMRRLENQLAENSA